MAAEDRDFYEHRGISATGIARALFTNVRSGSVQQGGSTITQQYIKNAALTARADLHAQGPGGGARHQARAGLREGRDPRLLPELDLLGPRRHRHRGRGADLLRRTPRRSWTSTSRRCSPGSSPRPRPSTRSRTPNAPTQRRVFALGGMLEKGWIDQATHDELVAAGPARGRSNGRTIDPGPNAYYLDAVRRELANQPEFSGGELFRGLRVHTELDPDLQAVAQEELSAGRRRGADRHRRHRHRRPAHRRGPGARRRPRLRPSRASTRATSSPRQPGSTFKAFTLQAFIEAGNSPETRVPRTGRDRGRGRPATARPSATSAAAAFGRADRLPGDRRRRPTPSTTRCRRRPAASSVIDAARRAGLPEVKGARSTRRRRAAARRLDDAADAAA